MKNYSVHILSIFALGFLLPISETLAQDSVPLDPYLDTITTVDKIDKEFFLDVIYEIASEIEFDFENIMGERIMYYENILGDTVKYLDLDYMKVYENYIDLPAQIRNDFVINEQLQQIRAIYNLGPSTDMELSFAKEWYDGIVDIMTVGNNEREWGLEKKSEVNVAGLPERTTFFLYEDDYSEFYIEIYYDNTLKRVNDSRLALIFVFPIW